MLFCRDAESTYPWYDPPPTLLLRYTCTHTHTHTHAYINEELQNYYSTLLSFFLSFLFLHYFSRFDDLTILTVLYVNSTRSVSFAT